MSRLLDSLRTAAAQRAETRPQPPLRNEPGLGRVSEQSTSSVGPGLLLLLAVVVALLALFVLLQHQPNGMPPGG